MGKVVQMTKKERIRSSRKQNNEINSISVLDFLKQNKELVRFELEVHDDGLGIRVNFKNSPLTKLYSAKELHEALDESLFHSLFDSLIDVLMQGIIENAK